MLLSRQFAPSQQPLGQVVALQVPRPEQVPLAWQVLPAPQTLQSCPGAPHAIAVLPVWQAKVEVSMQPAHAVHTPAEQTSPVGHEPHAAPPVPHRLGVVTVMHVPEVLQQPFAQLVALQVPAMPPPVAVPPPVATPPPVEPPPVATPPPVVVPPPVAAFTHAPPYGVPLFCF
jgi:hypothetical protein